MVGGDPVSSASSGLFLSVVRILRSIFRRDRFKRSAFGEPYASNWTPALSDRKLEACGTEDRPLEADDTNLPLEAAGTS